MLDGRRGLVPVNFVQRLVGEDLLDFHQVRTFTNPILWISKFQAFFICDVNLQAVVTSMRDVDESATTAVSELSLSRDVARLSETADINEGPEDDDNGMC